MTLRIPPLAPLGRVAPERRGAVLGIFCHGCATVFPLHQGRHVGKGINGRDHVASPCPHEGQMFRAGESWWEPAVQVLLAPVVAAVPSAAVAAAVAPPAPAAAPPK